MEEDHVEQVVDVCALQRGNLDSDRFATPVFGRDAFFLHLLLHAIDVGPLRVDLINRYDDGVVGLFSKFECFFSLWLEGVVSCDHEDRNVSYISSALSHHRESSVAGCIDKGDLLVFVINLVSTDVLSDPAGFTFDHIGFANGIE